MSSHSSPSHHMFNDDVRSHYDPRFTEDISLKMRVPDRIRVIGEQYDDEELPPRKQEEKRVPMMMVPDRILVAGHDQHLGIRDIPQDLELDLSFNPKGDVVEMVSPPRVLTVNEHEFPTIEESGEHCSVQPIVNNGHIPVLHSSQVHQSNSSLSGRFSPPDGMLSPTEEMVLLRRHVSKLSRRVMNLEKDSQQHSQREWFFYSLACAYFLIKGLTWLKRNW